MTFSQFISILKARWILALVVLLITVTGTVGVSLILPKSYTASSSVVLDVRTPDPVAGMAMTSMASPAYMATQVDIIESERVALRVVQTMKLTERPDVRRAWAAATEGRGNYEIWVSQLVRRGLDVTPSRESSVITVSYNHSDARYAATMANAFVRAYMDVTVGLRVSPARQYNEFFDARAKELREGVEKAQSKLAGYQREHGILATDERFDIENQRLNELSSQLVALQAVSAESTSRSAQARSSADQLNDVINNPVVAGLRADVSRQEARLQELGARLGEAHPQVAELRANIAELRQRIEEETRRVSGSVAVSNTINKQREAEIRASLDAQRAKVLALKQQRNEITVLQREVETAQRAYDQVVARQAQTSLESQNTQTNIAVLNAAEEPLMPSSPRIMLNALLSVFVGTVLAITAALVRELLDRRVRSLEDLADNLGLVVLGSLPPPMRGKLGSQSSLMLPNHVMDRLPRPNT